MSLTLSVVVVEESSGSGKAEAPPTLTTLVLSALLLVSSQLVVIVNDLESRLGSALSVDLVCLTLMRSGTGGGSRKGQLCGLLASLKKHNPY